MTQSARLEESAAAQFDTGGHSANRPACPRSALASSFLPFDKPFLDDPYSFFQQSLEHEPVFYSTEIDYWVISRYDDVVEVFRHPEIWSAAISLSAVTPMSPDVLQKLRDSEFRMNPVLTNLDPPEHIRIRKHATNAFSTRHVAAAEPWIRELADEFIDRLLEKEPDIQGLRHADMVSEFAYDLPAHVGMRFVGIPDNRVPDVKAWTANRVKLTWGRCNAAQQLKEADGLIEMWKYCESHVAAMLQHECDSFLGDLCRYHRENPDSLTFNEIASMLFTMIVAGHETTSNVLASAILALLSDRNLWNELVKDPAKIPAAVEEMLRFRPPVISWRRVATQDTEIAGQKIGKGSRVLLLLAAANHDPRQFPEPGTVELCRPNAKKHLAFGHGVHLCIGAGLARLELKVFLEQLVARMPGLTLDPDQRFEYPSSLSFRGPSALKVRW